MRGWITLCAILHGMMASGDPLGLKEEGDVYFFLSLIAMATLALPHALQIPGLPGLSQGALHRLHTNLEQTGSVESPEAGAAILIRPHIPTTCPDDWLLDYSEALLFTLRLTGSGNEVVSTAYVERASNHRKECSWGGHGLVRGFIKINARLRAPLEVHLYARCSQKVG